MKDIVCTILIVASLALGYEWRHPMKREAREPSPPVRVTAERMSSLRRALLDYRAANRHFPLTLDELKASGAVGADALQDGRGRDFIYLRQGGDAVRLLSLCPDRLDSEGDFNDDTSRFRMNLTIAFEECRNDQ